MTNDIIIIACVLFLVAYLFDITSAKTKLPTVVLLLVMGWGLRQIANSLALPLPNLEKPLPIFGTIGLILIVLDGSLELELKRERIDIIVKSALMAFLPLILFNVLIGLAFHYFGGYSFKYSFLNAVPFSVISSAIAIPSAKALSQKNREFITYETSFSDIIGVIIFNFVSLNEEITIGSVGVFMVQLVAIIVISIVATLALAVFLRQSNAAVKHFPIVLFVILIYALSKAYHLPSLLFILLFGLAMGNIDVLKRIGFVKKLNLEALDQEVHNFKALIVEMTFVIRVLFFLLFGFLIETQEILNPKTIAWALGITSVILLLRSIFLLVLKVPMRPLVFFAPRGLVTVLLFLSLPASQTISLANRSLVIQVVLLCAAVLMVGNLLLRKKDKENDNDTPRELKVENDQDKVASLSA